MANETTPSWSGVVVREDDDVLGGGIGRKRCVDNVVIVLC